MSWRVFATIITVGVAFAVTRPNFQQVEGRIDTKSG
ncbi:MAG: hypothetical protein HYX87_09055 [Chloroflexi bacterium]|nr:hypothetical protein [Chloroflexota bacterium]